jgi:hypothetical protein
MSAALISSGRPVIGVDAPAVKLPSPFPSSRTTDPVAPFCTVTTRSRLLSPFTSAAATRCGVPAIVMFDAGVMKPPVPSPSMTATPRLFGANIDTTATSARPSSLKSPAANGLVVLPAVKCVVVTP